LVKHSRKKSKKKSRLRSHAPTKDHKDILAYAYKQMKSGKPIIAGHAEHAEHEGGPLMSVREVEYNGHNIVIQTTYEIKIDGKLMSGHLFVDNSGRVYSHAMPTYSFPSAVDLVKNLIDTFPTSFPISRHVVKRKKRGK
jgi:hypothetical protein